MRASCSCPRVESLESRLLLATFLVTDSGDAPDVSPGDGICETAGGGPCTLRAAIQEANASANTDTTGDGVPDPDVIAFDIGRARLIDFEPNASGMFPDGSVAVDNMRIRNQFLVSHGVSFGLDADGDGLADASTAPELEAAGADSVSGFQRFGGAVDQAAAGFDTRLSQFFLRNPGGFGVGTPPSLLITYAAPTAAASGEIWDIDGNQTPGPNFGTEQWLVEALDASHNVIDSVTSPLGVAVNGPLDARPWVFSLDHAGVADIQAIRLTFVGTKINSVGLAFDNFSPLGVDRFYYRDDGVAGQITSANVTPTTTVDDSSIGDIDPDYPHSWFSIRPGAPLPAITDVVIIDGYTQPGASSNTQLAGNNALLRVELDGSVAGGDGLVINAAGSTVRGLLINRFADGIRLNAGGGVVEGNFIGIDPSLSLDLGNAQHGIVLSSVDAMIGGDTPGAANVIAFNGVGVSVDATASRVAIRGNTIHSQTGLGIDLFGPGVNLNDSGDVDTGANDGLNFPLLESALISVSDLTLAGFARPGSVIELFIADPDPSGFGEGKTFLLTLTEGSAVFPVDGDATTGTYGPGPVNGLNQGTDTTNRFLFTIPLASLPVALTAGTVLTATATDTSNNTSEFSGNVAVVALNDPPIVSNPIADLTVNEDAAPAPDYADLNLVFDDSDNPDTELVYTIVANTGSTIVDAAVGSDGTLDLSFLANQNGVAQITVRATDPGGLSVDDVFTVTVNAVNDPPAVANPIPDLTVNEDSPPVLDYADLNLVFQDPDNPDTELVYTIAANSGGAIVAVVIGADLKLDLSFLADQNGVAQITVRATDPGGLFADDVFTVTVNAVNDPPVASDDVATVNQNGGPSTIDVLANDSIAPDTGETLLITSVTQGTNGTVAIAAGGMTLTYTPNPDFVGADSFSYTINDGHGGSDTAMVSVSVVDVTSPTIGDMQVVVAKNVIQRFVVRFSEPLDSVNAQDLNNYQLFKLKAAKRGGFTRTPLPLISAVYDPASESVLLSPDPKKKPKQSAIYEVVAGAGITDLVGHPLDGNADRVDGDSFTAVLRRAKKLRYSDRDGDTVSLTLKKGGIIDLILSTAGDLMRISGSVANRTTLSGSVKRGRSGDGAVRLALLPSTPFINKLPASFQIDNVAAFAALVDTVLASK